jgi:hypothetical protein
MLSSSVDGSSGTSAMKDLLSGLVCAGQEKRMCGFASRQTASQRMTVRNILTRAVENAMPIYNGRCKLGNAGWRRAVAFELR